MLLEEFRKGMNEKISKEKDRWWGVPSMDNANPEDSKEYYENYFVGKFFYANSYTLRGSAGNITIPQMVEEMNNETYTITYNKTGKMAVLQYYLPSGSNVASYHIFSSKNGWTVTDYQNQNMAKFLQSVTLRRNRQTSFLVHKTESRSLEVKIKGNEVETPKEGFTTSYNLIVEYKTLESTPTLIKGHIRYVVNGAKKKNEIFSIVIKDGMPYMTSEEIQEDWWGLQLPDFRIPYFDIASPYNKVIHEHLTQPDYAGENLWIGAIMEFSENHKIMVKVADKWVPIPNLEDWDLAGIISEEAAQEYELYIALIT